MDTQSAVGSTQSRRRWLVWASIAFLQLLLMGSAFVGGRMLAGQNQRNNRSQFTIQLPAQLPKDPAAGTGTVQKVQDTVITLARRQGAPGGGASSANNQTDVAVTAETKYYKNVSSGAPGSPGGGQAQLQVTDATMADVKVGSNVMVWGTKSGERITAEVIYIQSAGR